MELNWNLSHLYLDDSSWETDSKVLESKIKELDNTKDNFIDGISSFNAFLLLKIEADELVEKLYCYAQRHLDLDSTLTKYQEMLKRALALYNKIEVINSYFETVLIKNSSKVKAYLQDKDLKKYHRYISLILRREKHVLNDEYKSKQCCLYTNNIHSLKSEYQSLLTTEMQFGNVNINGDKVEITRTNYSNLITNDDQLVRKTIFDNYTNGYISKIDDISRIYLSKLENDIQISSLENYNTLLSKVLFELELPNEIVEKLISNVNKNIDVMHQYNEFRKHVLGLDKYHVYDAPLSICKIPNISLKFDDAIKIIKDSLSILGDDYLAIIDRMLTEGWIDVYPKKNKRAMSFSCISYVGVPYILINYNKQVDSVRTLAHEMGHAIHTYYSKNNNEFEYFGFSLFLTEIASKVNEIIVNEYMLNHCNTKEEKKYILNNIISSFMNSIFGQTMLTEFEHDVITKLSSNEKITTEYLNNLYLTISKKYNGSSFEDDENIKYGWSKVPHFVMQDTYYVYQYAIGTSLAINIAYRILNNELGLIDKYKKFLSAGNSVSIEQALDYLDINLNDDSYINKAIEVLNNKINEIKNQF